MDKGHQQDEPIQPDDDDQGNTSEKMCHLIHNLVILYLFPLLFSWNLQVMQRKRDLLCMTLIKKSYLKLTNPLVLFPTVNFRDKMSAIISEYMHEPLIDNPKVKLFKNSLEY